MMIFSRYIWNRTASAVLTVLAPHCALADNAPSNAAVSMTAADLPPAAVRAVAAKPRPFLLPNLLDEPRVMPKVVSPPIEPEDRDLPPTIKGRELQERELKANRPPRPERE